MTVTFQEARNTYAANGNFQSEHTLDAYLRAIELFFDYLDDRRFELRTPLQSKIQTTSAELPVASLSADDHDILKNFSAWMQSDDDSSSRRPYAFATVELRLAGLVNWLEFLVSRDWLPQDFDLLDAVDRMKVYQKDTKPKRDDSKAVRLYYDLADLLIHYEKQQPSDSIRANPSRYERWTLTRMRNHAFLQMLAETGGQVSAILKFDTDIFYSEDMPLRVKVSGKNNHRYELPLVLCLSPVRDYIKARQLQTPTIEPLFISHDKRYAGNRMSRVIAWRVVQRAAKAVNIPKVSPHDLRHWRAKQMIDDGHSLEEVQQQLGHRSIHTIRSYYGHWVEERDKPSSGSNGSMPSA